MKIVECPRDAMQGIAAFIPTEDKLSYIHQLLGVGYDTLDFGSFVSPKAVPQMRDTEQIAERLEEYNGTTKLLAIVANVRGAEAACAHKAITYLGYPLSLSETFQQRNTNKSIEAALLDLGAIQSLCSKSGKTLVTYLSMGFGNPYGDPYDEGIVEAFVQQLIGIDASIISLADTVGIAAPSQIGPLVKKMIISFPGVEFGVHLHARPDGAWAKIEAAWNAGCRRMDGALMGFGGCPMAGDTLVGNLATERILEFLDQKGIETNMDREALRKASEMASVIFQD